MGFAATQKDQGSPTLGVGKWGALTRRGAQTGGTGRRG